MKCSGIAQVVLLYTRYHRMTCCKTLSDQIYYDVIKSDLSKHISYGYMRNPEITNIFILGWVSNFFTIDYRNLISIFIQNHLIHIVLSYLMTHFNALNRIAVKHIWYEFFTWYFVTLALHLISVILLGPVLLLRHNAVARILATGRVTLKAALPLA